MMRELEGRAEALAGTFKAHEVANTLWAYATVGREPGAGMLQQQQKIVAPKQARYTYIYIYIHMYVCVYIYRGRDHERERERERERGKSHGGDD